MDVDSRRVLAFRLAGQGLAAPAGDPLRGWAVQDSPPGAAAAALPEREEGFAEPAALAVEAVADALDGAVLSRDDLHEQLRRRLPIELLPWCPGCKTHHARRGLLVMAALRGRLCVAGRAGRQPAFARTDQWTGWEPPARAAAGAELVRRYPSGYGPSTPADLAQWAGLGKRARSRLRDARARVELAARLALAPGRG
jgi:winged helix DNA-binding protein